MDLSLPAVPVPAAVPAVPVPAVPVVPVVPVAPGMVSRRQRLRDATAEEIKAVARLLMAREGTSALNLRAIARELGMTPSALYRYFPSRDAILTALITDAYDSVGQAVEDACARSPADGTCTGILAAVHTFRRWALDHPQEFGLIYGAPVPGYQAPPEETLKAAMRTTDVLLSLLRRAIDQGLVTVPGGDEELPPGLRRPLQEVAHHKGHGLSAAEAAAAMRFWFVLLGSISAEVYGHMSPDLIAEGEPFFDHTMRRALIAIGVDEAAVQADARPPVVPPAPADPG